MKKQVGLLTASFLLMSLVSSAQNNCPEEFRYAGDLSGTGSRTGEFNETVVLKLPENATLDESYQQTKVQATNEKGKAQSNLRPQDIPKAIHIIPHGSSDHGKAWAVNEPQLKVIKQDSGTSARYVFGMRLFCSVPTSTFGETKGACDVGVRVCYKPKPRN